mmetsp:Transcript_15087/g.34786  ORF Transcript_15087/g.34786 Transcript_15087/m.34786 type:complete len:110 (+) Transcript_15087:203-532(+)
MSHQIRSRPSNNNQPRVDKDFFTQRYVYVYENVNEQTGRVPIRCKSNSFQASKCIPKISNRRVCSLRSKSRWKLTRECLFFLVQKEILKPISAITGFLWCFHLSSSAMI